MNNVILRKTQQEQWLHNFDKTHLIPFFGSEELARRRQIRRDQVRFRNEFHRKYDGIGHNPYKDKERAELEKDEHKHKHQHDIGHAEVEVGIPTSITTTTVIDINGSPPSKQYIPDDNRHQRLDQDDVDVPLTATTTDTSTKTTSHSDTQKIVQLEQDSSSSSSDED